MFHREYPASRPDCECPAALPGSPDVSTPAQRFLPSSGLHLQSPHPFLVLQSSAFLVSVPFCLPKFYLLPCLCDPGQISGLGSSSSKRRPYPYVSVTTVTVVRRLVPWSQRTMGSLPFLVKLLSPSSLIFHPGYTPPPPSLFVGLPLSSSLLPPACPLLPPHFSLPPVPFARSPLFLPGSPPPAPDHSSLFSSLPYTINNEFLLWPLTIKTLITFNDHLANSGAAQGCFITAAA